MSKVSVVVPIYNPGKKLEKCIKSVLHQSFKDFELILVNDGSTDNSIKICKKYKKIDDRIILIDKCNEGSIVSRKKGVEIANSKYVMFVDSDDWIDNRCIETLYNAIKESSVDVAVCNMYNVIGNSNLVKKKNNSIYFEKTKIFEKNEIRNKLIVAYFNGHPFSPSLCAKLYKKELLLNSGKYLDQIVFLGEDLYYNLEIFLKINKVIVIEAPLYFYRIGGFTSKYMPYLFDDMVSGYKIQKDVIDEYYRDTALKHYNGISIMLLNTFKTCLYNLFISNLSEIEIRNRIDCYLSNETLHEATLNKGAMKYFSAEYLLAINNNGIDYLYGLGQNAYKRSIPKMLIKKAADKFAVI